MLVSGPEEPLPEAALLKETEWLRRLARHMVGEDDADDVAQEASAAAVERPPRDPSRRRGWLAQVVRNAARTRYRDRMRRLRREAAAARDEAVPSGDDVVARAETQQRVVNAVLALDEPYRTTVLLSFFDDLPPRKVAERMGVPVATVHTRLRRGLERLRARLGERGRSWALVLLPLLPREGKLGSLLAAGGAVMSKKAAVVVVAAVLALSVGGVVWLSRVPGPDERSGHVAAAPREGGGEEVPEPGGGTVVAAEGRVRLRGRVVDADGNGIPGARVDLMAGAADKTEIGLFISRMGPGILDATRAAEQVRRDGTRGLSRTGMACDGEGRFDLATDPLPGDYLLARAPGYAVAADTGLSLLRSASGIEIRLTTQVARRVRVVDENRIPVAGAQVSLFSSGCVLARAETDASGRVDFTAEPRGEIALVEARGYPRASGQLHAAKEEEVTVEIGPAGPASSIEGTVLRASDRVPVEGAAVYFEFGGQLATTDAEGRFSLDRAGLRQSVYRMIVVDAGAEGVASTAVRDLPPGPLEILLHETVTLEGRLVGTMPLDGLRVLALQPGLPWRSARADASGAFRIEGAAADVPVCVVFDPWDPLYEEKGAFPHEAKYLPWTGHATFEIVAKGAIEGRVVDEAGAPVAGARVEMRPRARFADGVGSMPMCAGDEHTDGEGRFRIEGVSTRPPPSRPGVLYLPTVLRVAAEGFVWRDEGPLTLEPGEERAGLVIRLERGLSITGRVVTEDGSALPEFKVRVYERSSKPDGDRHSGWARVDADGRYRIDALPAGSYGVHVSAEGYQRVWHESVAAGSEAPPLVLRRAATIEGIVVDEAGRPLGGVHVSARSGRSRGSAGERTGADGRFRIRHLEPGAYDVSAAEHGYLWDGKAGVVAPSSDVRFVLRRGLSIKGRVVRPDGTPLPNVTVRAERIKGPPSVPGAVGQASGDDDGRFEITGLSEGEYRVAFDSHAEHVLLPLDGVAAGSEILVRAEAGSFIEGQLVDRDGGPMSGVSVQALPLDPDGYAGNLTQSGDDGRYRVGPLKGSRFALVAGRSGVCGFALDVAAGSTDNRIVMGRGEAIAGRVVDADGNAAAASVVLTHEKLGDAWAWHCAAVDGRFRVEGLPPGVYFVWASPENVVRSSGRGGMKVEAGAQDVVLAVK